MKKSNIFFATMLAAILITGCLKDVGKRSYIAFTPITETTASLRAKVAAQSPKPVVDAGKLFLMGNYVFLNEKEKGIHIIDNSNPASPQNISYINIPGNTDLWVKGNTLYANCYTDILAIDISNINSVSITKVLEDVFSDIRFVNGYSTTAGNVITGWQEKTVTDDLEISEGQGIWKNGTYYYYGGGVVWSQGGGGGWLLSSGGPTVGNPTVAGKAGSMSRFTAVNNYLYAVSNSMLHSVNISNAPQPRIDNSQNIGWNIETIYPFKEKLFIGSQTGMQIFSLSNAMQPVFISSFAHARLCDPVIADDNYAYITLHASENICVGTQNELDVVNITNLSSPSLVKRVELTKPYGLGKDGNLLFVCDDNAGVKVFDASNPENPTLKTTLPLTATYDVICNNGVALVSAKDGLHQYNYSNANNIFKLSKFGY